MPALRFQCQCCAAGRSPPLNSNHPRQCLAESSRRVKHPHSPASCHRERRARLSTSPLLLFSLFYIPPAQSSTFVVVTRHTLRTLASGLFPRSPPHRVSPSTSLLLVTLFLDNLLIRPCLLHHFHFSSPATTAPSFFETPHVSLPRLVPFFLPSHRPPISCREARRSCLEIFPLNQFTTTNSSDHRTICDGQLVPRLRTKINHRQLRSRRKRSCPADSRLGQPLDNLSLPSRPFPIFRLVSGRGEQGLFSKPTCRYRRHIIISKLRIDSRRWVLSDFYCQRCWPSTVWSMQTAFQTCPAVG